MAVQRRQLGSLRDDDSRMDTSPPLGSRVRALGCGRAQRGIGAGSRLDPVCTVIVLTTWTARTHDGVIVPRRPRSAVPPDGVRGTSGVRASHSGDPGGPRAASVAGNPVASLMQLPS